MAKQEHVSGKVQNQGNGKFKIEKGDQPHEVDIDIELPVNGNYVVEKLKTNVGGPKGLPGEIDGNPIRWFNNFSIKENGNYIKKRYKVTMPGLVSKLKEKNSQLVIYSDTHDPKLYYYGTINSDTFELTDGDPAGGAAP